jgi:hypothetical protein
MRFGGISSMRTAVQHVDAPAIVRLEEGDFRHRSIVGREVGLQASGYRLRIFKSRIPTAHAARWGANTKLNFNPGP